MSDLVERLEPCPNPWCFSHEESPLRGNREPYIYPNADDGGPVHIKCPCCSLTGPTKATVTEAVAAWNERPELTRLRSEVERLTLERDEARAEVRDAEIVFLRELHRVKQDKLTTLTARTREVLAQVVDAYDACSGAEPSLSVLQRSIDVDLRGLLTELKDTPNGQ